MKRKAFTLFLLLIAITCVAQSELSDWKNISSKNFISRIIHDQNYLYVSAMGGGVVKIDKSSGEQTLLCRANRDIPDNSVIDITLHNDELWLGMKYYGWCKMKNNTQIVYNRKNTGFHEQQYMAGIAFEDNGNILVGGLAYLYRLNGLQCINEYPINIISAFAYVSSIKIDSKKNIWVGCFDVMYKATFCQLTDDGLKPISHPYGNVNRIEIIDDIVWLATESGLVSYKDGVFTAYTTNNSNLPENYLYDVKSDEKGFLWMVSNHYVIKYDGVQFTSYQYLPQNNDDNLTCIDVDGDDVYVGSRFQGLLKLEENTFSTVPLIDNQLYNNTINLKCGSIDADNNFVTSTLYGLSTYSLTDQLEKFVPMPQLDQVEADKDGVVWGRSFWYSTDTCLLKFERTDTIVYSKKDYPFNESSVTQIKFDNRNRLWVATLKGLYCRDGDTWTAYNKNNSGLSFEEVRCMAFDSKNNLWCGTRGGGLFFFDGVNWTQYTKSNSQLPSDCPMVVVVDKNDIVWINCRYAQYYDTYGIEFGFGLTSFDGTNWIAYNRNNSPILSDCIWDIQIDGDNNKWLATAGDVGLTCFNGTDWKIYDVENSGIALNEVTKITIDSKNDLIWLTQYPGSGMSVAKLNCLPSNIKTVRQDDRRETDTYDLQGRKIKSPRKGIYIRNGKKIVY